GAATLAAGPNAPRGEAGMTEAEWLACLCPEQTLMRRLSSRVWADGGYNALIAQPRGEPAMPAADRPARILIAEDTPQAAELLEAYLADTDYEVAFASDGQQTLERVVAWKPDLILLDVMMPRISGFEVCKRLRSDPATHGV